MEVNRAFYGYGVGHCGVPDNYVSGHGYVSGRGYNPDYGDGDGDGNGNGCGYASANIQKILIFI